MEVRFPKLVLFGDSITQESFGDGGWGAALADHFQRRCDVINRGFSGYTSDFNKLILPHMLRYDLTPKDSIAAVVILLGSNDSVLPGKDKRSLSLDAYLNNMNNIISQFVDNGLPMDRIILMTPPAIIEEMWAKKCAIKGREMNLSSSRASSFASACGDLGVKLGIKVIDLNTSMQKEENWSRFLSDGLHLSREGSKYVASKLIPALEAKLHHLPSLFPDWDKIDATNPAESLAKYIV